MFEALQNLLNGTDDRDGPPTPDQVREAIETNEEHLEEARSRVQNLKEEHGDLLLTASDKEIEAHEEKIAKAERDVARGEAAAERLEERLEEAKEQQKVVELEEAAEESADARKEGAELLEEFEKHAGALVEILERIEELDQTISSVQSKFRHADREITKQVERAGDGDVDFRTPDRPNNMMEPGSITDVTVIPPVSPNAPSWGGVRWRNPKPRTPSSSDTDHDQRPPGVYDDDGNLVDGRGRKRVRQPGVGG